MFTRKSDRDRDLESGEAADVERLRQFGFLRGKELGDTAVEVLGLSQVEVRQVNNWIAEAARSIDEQVLASIHVASDSGSVLDRATLDELISTGASNQSDGQVLAVYVVDPFADEGGQIRNELESRLRTVVGDEAENITDQLSGVKEFWDFGVSGFSIALWGPDKVRWVYVQKNLPDNHPSSYLLPYLSFNKRFGGFFVAQ